MKDDNDGWKELYLYKNNTSTGSNNASYTDAKNAGLIAIITGSGTETDYRSAYNSSGSDKSTSVIYFSVTVDGDKLANNVYLRYGASGSGSDTWIVSNVNVYTYAVKK